MALILSLTLRYNKLINKFVHRSITGANLKIDLEVYDGGLVKYRNQSRRIRRTPH